MTAMRRHQRRHTDRRDRLCWHRVIPLPNKVRRRTVFFLTTIVAGGVAGGGGSNGADVSPPWMAGEH